MSTAGRLAEPQVEAMFDRIASVYDLMNSVMTAGMHQRWRERAVDLADFLRGGSEFGATTLSRFYSIHMLLIPGLIAALIGAHLYLVAKLGTTAPPWLKAEKAKELSKEEI